MNRVIETLHAETSAIPAAQAREDIDRMFREIAELRLAERVARMILERFPVTIEERNDGFCLEVPVLRRER
jgi:hypothetical protein